jgi:sugar lactone lactonase YvrE
VLFGDWPADVVSASSDRVIVRIPESPAALGLRLRVGPTDSDVFPFSVAARLAGELHPLTSPAVAPDGSIVTTISGSRGQQVSQPIVRITRSGEKVGCACEIMNPTGLAFGPDGQLYVSSRHDGVVYRYHDFEELESFAEDLGIACGLAFDSKGNLYVGDRGGKIFRIDSGGSRDVFARLEPSISAYHLAMDREDRLYVTAPSFSLRDRLYRIGQGGRIEVVWEGLARPQGLAVTSDGSVLVAASYQGRKGIFRFDPEGNTLVHHVCGPMLVGVAVAPGALILADGSSIYRLSAEGTGHRPV